MRKSLLLALSTLMIYSFAQGATTPYVSRLAPVPDQVNVPQYANITFHIHDDQEGIEFFSVFLIVNGELCTPTLIDVQPPYEYEAVYNPPEDLPLGQVIDCGIQASDQAGNSMPSYNYRFTVAATPITPTATPAPTQGTDFVPPFTGLCNPARNATNVPLDANISFRIMDTGSGVDESSVFVSVKGTPVTPNITGTPINYLVSYNPDTPFGYNEIVGVMISAKDIDGNEMPLDIYEFTTLPPPTATPTATATATNTPTPTNTPLPTSTPTPTPDTQPPFPDYHYPQRHEYDVPNDTSILVHITDEGTGVNPTTLSMSVEGIDVAHWLRITRSQADYVLFYNPPQPFNEGQIVDVAVNASDLAGNTMPTYLYNFTIILFTPTPEPLETPTPTPSDTYTVSFNAGWNSFSFPADPLYKYTVAQLANEINTIGIVSTTYSNWGGNTWQIYQYGMPFNNFEIELGKGYFIHCENAGAYSFEGEALSDSIDIDLVPGWNFYGLPYSEVSYTASTLAATINSEGGQVEHIARWNNGAWQIHQVGLPFNNFAIESDRGYFIKSASNFLWKP